MFLGFVAFVLVSWISSTTLPRSSESPYSHTIFNCTGMFRDTFIVLESWKHSNFQKAQNSHKSSKIKWISLRTTTRADKLFFLDCEKLCCRGKWHEIWVWLKPKKREAWRRSRVPAIRTIVSAQNFLFSSSKSHVGISIHGLSVNSLALTKSKRLVRDFQFSFRI